MALSEKAWAGLLAQRSKGQLAATAPVGPRDPFLNQLERDYAAHLELRRRAGEVNRWCYEGVRLRIGWRKTKKAGKLVASYYTPDFHVQMADGEVQLHETKGRMMEAAAVRLAACAELYPYRILLVKRNKGAWEFSWV